MVGFNSTDSFSEIARRKECCIKNNEIDPGVHKNHKHLQATHFPRQLLKMAT
jgi:hypothetical protein